MNACLQDQITFDAQRIRGIQDRHPREHAALLNWGRCMADRRGIFPTLKPCSIWDQYRHDGEEYGDLEGEDREVRRVAYLLPAKPEPLERQQYQEGKALDLDDRIRSPGGLGIEIQRAIGIAYTTREVPEDQFWKMAGCSSLDSFCERLEAALIFVGRFS